MNDLTRRQMIVGSSALAASLSALTLPRPLFGSTEPAAGARRSFKPGEIWLDTAGKPIQAHAGSIIQVGDAIYWYGENKEFTTAKTKVWTWGVRCYRSTDLYNWEDLGLIIPPDEKDP